MTSLLEKELFEAVQQEAGKHERKQVRPTIATISAPEPTTDLQPLPRQIEGGFAGLAADLDRRNRDWTTMLRQLEQHRLALESSETERDRLYQRLTDVLPDVQRTLNEMTSAVAISKSGDLSAELTTHFSENMRALDDLEQVSTALTNNFLWFRSAWEQYARSVIRAERLRDV